MCFQYGLTIFRKWLTFWATLCTCTKRKTGLASNVAYWNFTLLTTSMYNFRNYQHDKYAASEICQKLFHHGTLTEYVAKLKDYGTPPILCAHIYNFQVHTVAYPEERLGRSNPHWIFGVFFECVFAQNTVKALLL